MHGLAVYLKEGLPFARDLSLENSRDFDWLYFIQCLTSFSSINHFLPLYAPFLMQFHRTLMRFSQSTHLLVFVFGDFNVHFNIHVALDISFDRIWHAGLLHKYQIISSSPSNRRLWVVLDGKSPQEYPDWSCTFPTINDLPDDIIFIIAIYVSDATLYSKCDQTSDLWQQLELASESDLWDTMDWAGSDLLISMLENLSWFSLTGLITLVLLMWK